MTKSSTPRLALSAALLLAVLAIGVAGCSSARPAASGDSSATSSSSSAAATPPATPQEGKLYTPAYKPNGNEVGVIKSSKEISRILQIC